jgi:hypothetical protein
MIYWPCQRREEVFVQPSLNAWQAVAVATQFGVTLAVAVGLGIFLGSAIDSWLGFNTIPVFTMVGVFAGLISAIASTIQMMGVLNRRNRRKVNGERKE